MSWVFPKHTPATSNCKDGGFAIKASLCGQPSSFLQIPPRDGHPYPSHYRRIQDINPLERAPAGRTNLQGPYNSWELYGPCSLTILFSDSPPFIVHTDIESTLIHIPLFSDHQPFPAQPQVIIFSFTNRFTLMIPAEPYFLGSIVSGFSFSTSFTPSL